MVVGHLEWSNSVNCIEGRNSTPTATSASTTPTTSSGSLTPIPAKVYIFCFFKKAYKVKWYNYNVIKVMSLCMIGLHLIYKLVRYFVCLLNSLELLVLILVNFFSFYIFREKKKTTQLMPVLTGVLMSVNQVSRN